MKGNSKYGAFIESQWLVEIGKVKYWIQPRAFKLRVSLWLTRVATREILSSLYLGWEFFY